jgi:hypothetical protein
MGEPNLDLEAAPNPNCFNWRTIFGVMAREKYSFGENP